jgi:starvation-inducible DNA-binding protein
MATTTQRSHLPAVDERCRHEVGRTLQATLVELVDLSLLGERLHWNTLRQPFRPLHAQLAAIVDSWRELSDAVAQCAARVGVEPDGQSGSVTTRSRIGRVAGSSLDTDGALRDLFARLAEVTERVRARSGRLGALDPVSQVVLIEVADELQKQLWTLRTSLDAGGA